MEAGNVNEFINNLELQDEMVRYDNFLYYFYGIRYDRSKKVYYTRIDRFKDDIYHFIDEFYYFEDPSFSECLKHLLEDPYWSGKSFYEIESKMVWVDG